QARTCIIQPSLDDVLQCTDHGRVFVVDLRRHICTCGYWQLSGVPCVHGVAAISYMRYDVIEYVDQYYTVHFGERLSVIREDQSMYDRHLWMKNNRLQHHSVTLTINSTNIQLHINQSSSNNTFLHQKSSEYYIQQQQEQ
ncbi:hypothetical protein LINPERPRIM_LOCUS23846, partial [Linum perenne]